MTTPTQTPLNPMALPEQCPQGVQKALWYLSSIDNVFVKQKVELMQMFTNIETNNKYEIQNGAGQQVYFAAEQTGCCQRQLCGAHRAFTITVLDNQGVKVMELTRPLRCDSAYSCGPLFFLPLNFCCLQILHVTDGEGTSMGTVNRNWSLCRPYFDIKDEKDQTVLQITGPFFTWSCCGSDVHFPVSQVEGGTETEVGMIAKKWSGLAKEVYTTADNYSVQFPLEMPVNHKALLIAAALLIDFMYFESPPPKDTVNAQHQRM